MPDFGPCEVQQQQTAMSVGCWGWQMELGKAVKNVANNSH